MPTDLLRTLLVLLLAVPFAGAVVVAALGPRRLDAVRWASLGVTLFGLAAAVVVAVAFARLPDHSPDETFAPEFVPGAPAEDVRHATTWDVLPLGAAPLALPDQPAPRPPAVQFFVGIDGLNVWLVLLTAVLMVSAVLVSWVSVTERANEFYAWLLALSGAMLGVFVSFDVVLFYVFFELTLVPLFFLIGIWGGPQRQHAARKFFIYTLAGSLITLLGVLAVVLACSENGGLTFSLPDLVRRAHLLPEATQRWIFVAMMVGFAVKVPLVPVHTWLPLAHVEAPTAGSVLLAGVLLKLGSYGFLRLCLPLVPNAAATLGMPMIGVLAVTGIVYGAFCSLAQDDIKKLVAYSSVSHMGFCMLGLFALNATGLSGGLLQMINHGLSTGALFLLVGMLYERYHTRKMADYGGLAARLKLLSFFMVFIVFPSIGLPGLNGFVGEVLVLLGAWSRPALLTLTVLACSGIVLGAWYLLTLLLKVFFGPVKEPGHGEGHAAGDLKPRELAALLPIAVCCVALGVYPQPVLDAARPDVDVVAKLVAKPAAGEHAEGRPAQHALTEKVPGETSR
jgi:NADH-quinone oxidoreductase subunit M